MHDGRKVTVIRKYTAGRKVLKRAGSTGKEEEEEDEKEEGKEKERKER